MSTTGVPSIASIGPIRMRFPAILRIVTGWRPSGFGRSGDRVANTPVRGRFGSERGCTFNTSRFDRCSQVMTMIWSPTRSPSSPSRANAFTASQASGAPSEPCIGAFRQFLRLDRITPIGRSCIKAVFDGFFSGMRFRTESHSSTRLCARLSPSHLNLVTFLPCGIESPSTVF